MKNKISPLTQNTHALKMSTLNEFINLEKIYKLKNGLNLKFHLAIHCLGCSIFNLYIFCGKKCGESKLFSEGVLECIIIIVSLRFFLLNVAQRPGSKIHFWWVCKPFSSEHEPHSRVVLSCFTVSSVSVEMPHIRSCCTVLGWKVSSEDKVCSVQERLIKGCFVSSSVCFRGIGCMHNVTQNT